MICPKCSKEIPSGSVFCQMCGNPLSPQSRQVSSPQPQPYPQVATQQPLQPQTVATQPPTIVVSPTPSKNEEKIVSRQKRILQVCYTLEFLLFIVAVGIGYLVFVQYRQTHSSESLDSSNRVLTVQIDENLSADEISDTTQITNALKNGGMIRLKSSNINSTLDSKLDKYAAANSENMYWVIGALLNYISSEGWELIQAPTTGLSQIYYFKKK